MCRVAELFFDCLVVYVSDEEVREREQSIASTDVPMEKTQSTFHPRRTATSIRGRIADTSWYRLLGIEPTARNREDSCRHQLWVANYCGRMSSHYSSRPEDGQLTLVLQLSESGRGHTRAIDTEKAEA